MPATMDQDGRSQSLVPLLLTVADVARALRWGRSKTYRLLAGGDIRSVRGDGSRRIRVRDLEAYVAGLGPAALTIPRDRIEPPPAPGFRR